MPRPRLAAAAHLRPEQTTAWPKARMEAKRGVREKRGGNEERAQYKHQAGAGEARRPFNGKAR